MKKVLFKQIKELHQVRHPEVEKLAGTAMKELPSIHDAFLCCEDGRITAFGPMSKCPHESSFQQVIDVYGKSMLPCFCDSHTHLVYAGDRSTEFVDRLMGLSYQQIAQKGGGILNSAELLQKTSEEDLYQQSAQRLSEVISLGTGAIEIKSGYGLTVAAELKMLRVIKKLKDNFPIPVQATLLAAHALPLQFKNDRRGYLNQIVHELIPEVAKLNLATYVDVFCERGYFSTSEMELIFEVGASHQLIPKAHVNQFSALGGIEVAVAKNAQSVDHLEILTDRDLDALKNSETIPVALPGCSFFLGIPYTPVKKLLDAGLPVALATDFNPGSAPSGNMNFVVSAACLKMGMTPAEAINGATLNGAFAMGLADEVGSIALGKLANLIITKPIESVVSLPYRFGSNLIDSVYLQGKRWRE